MVIASYFCSVHNCEMLLCVHVHYLEQMKNYGKSLDYLNVTIYRISLRHHVSNDARVPMVFT